MKQEQNTLTGQINKLKKRNKKLKRSNYFLTAYVVLSAIIILYNNYFHQFFN